MTARATSALQLLVPRNMPFGAVSPSKAVAAVASKISLAQVAGTE